MFGGMGGGPGGPPGAPQAGLPFGGIPPELQSGVDLLLQSEPERGEPDIEFTQVPTAMERKRLTLTSLLTVYPSMLVLAGVLVGIIALATQLGPSLVSYAINHGMTPPHTDYGVVVVCALLYLVSIAISAGAQWGQAKVTGRLASWVMNDLRVTVFRHLQRLSLDFFTEEKAGVVMSRMTSDVENLQQLLQDGLAQFAIQGLTMVVITVILFFTNVRLATITVVAVLPPLVVMSIWFKRASERGYSKVRDGIALVLADLSESLQGVRIVTAHNRQRHNVEHHRNVVGTYRDANMYTGRINGIYGPGSQLISVLGQVLILGIGGEMYLNHQLSIGALTAFFLYVNRFFAPIQLLVQQYNTFQQGRASVFKLQDLLENEPSVLESPTATELPPIEGEIRFDHVTFAYNPDAIVLGRHRSHHSPRRDRGLRRGHRRRQVHHGQAHHALLRPHSRTGAHRRPRPARRHPGLAAPPARRRPPGAVPLRRHHPGQHLLRPARRTGRSGLGGGQQDRPDRAGAPSALRTRHHRARAGAVPLLGERQLIALARAFMAQPRVLVLDEATSNLDLQSETKIEAALDVLLQQRTAVLIAHRLSTAMRADRIVVVGDGKLLEVGSHDELVALGGHYADMYATWISQSHAA